jgi:autotransporter-associated beta strand protein
VANAFAGVTYFQGSSSAGSAQIIARAAVVDGGGAGYTAFSDDSTAGNSTIVAEGSDGPIRFSGLTQLTDRARGGNATLIAGGATAPDGRIGEVHLNGSANAGNSQLIARSGEVAAASGGRILIRFRATGATARAEVQANATLDISDLFTDTPGTSLGSLEGAGRVFLGNKTLAIGGNNLTTTFSGVIEDGGLRGGVGGSLTKVGTGTLILSGNNFYTGTTTVLDGILRVTGSLKGPVKVDGGVLGGNGMFFGGVTVGPGGNVAPGASIGTFSSAGLLSFESGSAYDLEIDSSAQRADRIDALNVTIGTGVHLDGEEIGKGALPIGFQFTIIENTSSNPTIGTFNGVPEGSQIAVGNNLFAISYLGGNGNDVVLTNLIPEPHAGICTALGAALISTVRRRRIETGGRR